MVISLFSRQDSKKVLIPNISTSLLIYPNFDFRTILPNIFELGEKTGTLNCAAYPNTPLLCELFKMGICN